MITQKIDEHFWSYYSSQTLGGDTARRDFLIVKELMKETKENISCWSKCRLGKALWPRLVTDLQKVKAEKDLRKASPSQYHSQMRRPRARRMRSLVGKDSEFMKEQRLELHSRATVGPLNWREGYRLKDSFRLRWLWRTFWVLPKSWVVNKGLHGGEGFTWQSRNHCMKKKKKKKSLHETQSLTMKLGPSLHIWCGKISKWCGTIFKMREFPGAPVIRTPCFPLPRAQI